MRHRSTRSLVALAALLATGCGHSGPAGTLATQALPTTPGAAAAHGPAPAVSVVKNPSIAKAVAVATSSAPGAAAAASSGAEPAVPNELIVHFKGDARPLPGASLQGALSVPHTYVYKLKPNAYTLADVEDWENAKDVDYVEPNFIYHATAVPNDPNFGDSWGVGAINAPDVWGVSQGEGVTVAVVDTGVAADQPDLAGQVLPGIDLVNSGGTAADDHGHGTHVAGTIAAIANNGIGVAGVAPHAKILPVKVLDSSGSGTNETIANGILAAAQHGARVINLSLGGPDESETLRRAIAQVTAQGVVVCCAAGNDGDNQPFYPAACDGAIGVGAVDTDASRASFSNYGDYVAIAAPGVNIGSLGYQGGVVSMSGTSMATPHVAGTAALLLSVFPQLKPRNVLTAMQRGGQPTTGFPMTTPPRALDAEAAMTAVGTLDLTAPSRVTGVAGTPGAPGEVRLTWQAATDNVAVTGYRVLRDGTPVGTTATTSFTDAGINGDAHYSVTAYDADGNESQPSDAVDVQAGTASDKIVGLRASERGTDHLVLTWQTAQPMRCSLSWGTNAQLGTDLPVEATASTEHSMRIDGLKRFHSYSFRVIAMDASGQAYYSDIKKARTKIWWLFSL